MPKSKSYDPSGIVEIDKEKFIKELDKLKTVAVSGNDVVYWEDILEALDKAQRSATIERKKKEKKADKCVEMIRNA